MYNTAEILKAIEAEAIKCQKCALRSGCRQVVFGEGNPEAGLMLIGEGPGAEEDSQGRPFVGAAGQLLDKILEASSFHRREVYIANIVKCRPPNNRTPSPEEMQSCVAWVEAQIAAVRPQIIVCLGSVAARAVIDQECRITRARGKWTNKYGIWIMPTFHPSALLRDARKKRPVWEDFKMIRDRYNSLNQRRQPD